MLSRLRSRVNHATVVAYLALFIALGGVGYAAATLPANSVGTRQLKNGAVTKRKLANGAVTTRKLARGFSAPPSGRASGDLTGSYPHPAIAHGVITPAMFGTIPTVRTYNSADETIADSTFTTLTFDTNRYDTAGMHSTSTNTSRLTAPISGVYAVTANVRFDLHGLELVPLQPYFQDQVSLTVTNGALSVKGQAAVKLPTSGFATVDANMHHFAIAKGRTIVQVNAMGPFVLTYVNPADDPSQKSKTSAAIRE